ncbi:MAG: hypothetical protein ACOCTS_03310 [Thermodesulfobacteriota bacterium]
MHPTRPAHWHCLKCSQSFCPHCVFPAIRKTPGSPG